MSAFEQPKITIYDLLSSEHVEHDIFKFNGKEKKIAFVLDISGSTEARIEGKGYNVLQKQIEILTNIALKNKENNHVFSIFPFSSYAYEPVILKYDDVLDMIHIPNFRSDGLTYTHLALKEINKSRYDIVIIITDGASNSSEIELKRNIQQLKNFNTDIFVIAVSPSKLNMNVITTREENRIAGMDLVNILRNDISQLVIYSAFHYDEPFNGATSSYINKDKLAFLTIPISKDVIIPEFINILLDKMYDNREHLIFGVQNIDFKKFAIDIGKLFAIMYSTFPNNHYLILKLIDVSLQCNIGDITDEFIIKLITHGFNCVQKKIPIVYSNLDEKIKVSSVKHNEFQDAISMLTIEGTTLGDKETISFPLPTGLCVYNNNSNLSISRNLEEYRNSSDSLDNTYFSIDISKGQATRIALRKLADKLGFPRPRDSPSVVFMTSTQILLMIIKHESFIDSVHYDKLKSLAIIQTSMENMIRHGQYSGRGFFEQWKTRQLPAMHFSNPKTHTTLYTDNKINPLKMSEPIWWAAMMLTLGIFDKQMNVYEHALRALNIETEIQFINYLRTTYSSKIIGNVEFVSLTETPISLFTFEPFTEMHECFMLKRHTSPSGTICDTKTIYDRLELTYVYDKGCIFCKYKPTQQDIEPYIIKNSEIEIREKSTRASALIVIDDGTAPQLDITTTFRDLSISTTPKKILIQLVGITGSGKSTFAEYIKTKVEEMNGSCYIVSSDNYDKKKLPKKQKTFTINTEIKDFDRVQNELTFGRSRNNFKVIVVDLCNENGTQNHVFSYDLSHYREIKLFPNLIKEKFEDYVYWSLRNILQRQKSSPDTLYYLNPIDASSKVCITVHNNKMKGLARFLRLRPIRDFDCDISKEEIMAIIDAKASEYASNLESYEDVIDKLFITHGLV